MGHYDQSQQRISNDLHYPCTVCLYRWSRMNDDTQILPWFPWEKWKPWCGGRMERTFTHSYSDWFSYVLDDERKPWDKDALRLHPIDWDQDRSSDSVSWQVDPGSIDHDDAHDSLCNSANQAHCHHQSTRDCPAHTRPTRIQMPCSSRSFIPQGKKQHQPMSWRTKDDQHPWWSECLA